ncbi:MAG TPA: glycosyltransferase family 1 protein, partial [Planctomycetota bacterium]|nr:glycosyltransferase family 1 protein [Planctomycetota bacterium]
EPRKNPRVVLEALASLPRAERRPVVFVGPEGGFDLLEEARKLGVVEWVERRGVVAEEELVRLYNDAIALVFPSLYEGFGLPLVEAFACGTPVIASNAASLPEVAGEAAILFAPTDAGGLANAMRSLNDEEKRSELRARGFQRLESCSQQRVCEQLAHLYSELDL